MSIILVAHNIRSTHNVGAFFRTCDGLGIDNIIFSGYTPYPTFVGDSRLPHFADKLTRQIHKTALGAETVVNFECFETVQAVIDQAKQAKAVLVALEQHPSSRSPAQCRHEILQKFKQPSIYLFVGNELHGVEDLVLHQMDLIMEIPMHGKKESLNVSVATGIALYELSR